MPRQTLNYRGCRFTLNDEVFTIEDQTWDRGGLIVYFQNDGTKWVPFDEICENLLDKPKADR